MAFETLNIGASALSAFQTVTNVIGNNVANSGTVGYTRQTANLSAVQASSGDLGGGVVVTSVSRARDALADITYRNASAASAATTARATVLDQAQNIIGTTTSGLSSDVSAFYSTWSQLSITPTDSGARASVIDAANTVARDIQGASSQLDDIATTTLTGMTSSIAQVNTLSAQVADLNQKIQVTVGEGNSANDLEDQRDNALDQLVTLTGATIRTDAQGNDNVFVGSATLVRGGASSDLQVNAPTGVAPTVTFTDGTAAPVGGSIGGSLSALTTDLPDDRAQLDSFSTQFATLVNNAHAAGYDANGNAGAAIFTGTNAATFGVSTTLTSDSLAASASGAAADGNNALVMANLRAVTMSGGHTSTDVLSGFAGNLGNAAASSATASTAAAASLSAVSTARDSSNGVNTDTEMVNLLEYQRGYQAAAQLISVADKMLDTLLGMVV
jgi:flagellar hook-associated protein 1 FlgK